MAPPVDVAVSTVLSVLAAEVDRPLPVNAAAIDWKLPSALCNWPRPESLVWLLASAALSRVAPLFCDIMVCSTRLYTSELIDEVVLAVLVAELVSGLMAIAGSRLLRQWYIPIVCYRNYISKQ